MVDEPTKVQIAVVSIWGAGHVRNRLDPTGQETSISVTIALVEHQIVDKTTRCREAPTASVHCAGAPP